MIIGSCLCGDVQFEFKSEVRWCGACHCKMCQKQSGGAFQVWASFYIADFKLVSGVLKKFKSSSNVIRSSCSICSSHLFFQYIDNETDIYVTATAINEIEIKPQEHIWWNSKLKWLCLDDKITIRN